MHEEKQKKDKWIKVRIDLANREYLHQKAASTGRTLSDLIRESLDRVRAWTPENIDIQNERLRLTARASANINQVAKWANIYKSKADASEVIQQLKVIEAQLNELLAAEKRK